MVVSALAAHTSWKAHTAQRSYCSTATRAAAAITGKPGAVFADADIMVYQYKICPFCNKLKAVMDFLGIPYKVTEVNPLTKKEIKFSKDYQKVPIVRLDEQYLHDSPAIIQALLDGLKARGAVSKDQLDAFASPDAMNWAEWADKQLAVLLFPNITRSFGESYQAFSYVQGVSTFSALDKAANQALGSFAMWMAQGKIKKKYNIEDEREALYGALRQWTTEIQGKKFSGGAVPNLGDLCVFGCLRAIEGLDAHTEAMQEEKALAEWYARMLGVLQYGPI
ncbi:glutathione S-transferase [Tribonema minus]|uniref:Prostaglandin E synthase 2 n=1 Tax=Tribonema minus TaxID=303371 RepID=A0A835YKS9_9STRA|nr:glutathione S-transferase [Tribonema minus]